jgi:hypothetical protein
MKKKEKEEGKKEKRNSKKQENNEWHLRQGTDRSAI